MEHVDVAIVGAGISGIGAAYHLQERCPTQSYLIIEGRASLGGTWDLFRYPGVRSDSDMFTLGYSFKPWTQAKAIADGPSILKYLRDTSREYGIDQRIRYNRKVISARWLSATSTWELMIERTEGSASAHTQLSCRFLFMCGGYYDYDSGFKPKFSGDGRFAGPVVHPQSWPKDLDYRDRSVLVIGSGATAVTLVPELAREARHVTMLQRSPTYVVSRSDEDAIANHLKSWLPMKAAYALVRWKNVLFGMYFFNLCRRDPDRVKAMIKGGVRQALGADFDVDKHFSPRYDPWDQRLCLVPNGDLFEALRCNSASIVTDTIREFTETGVELTSGERIEADIIVTATGLNMKALGGVAFEVDGTPIDVSESFMYKGMMISGLPNLAMSMGYTNASWTLKCDLTCLYVTRLLNHMRRRGFSSATPVSSDTQMDGEPLIDFSSGYVRRAIDAFPKQGPTSPWRLYQNYVLDLLTLAYGPVSGREMRFR